MGALQVFIPKETDDTRVAANLSTVKSIIKLGLQVAVESKAGEKSFISDREYEDAGAVLGSAELFGSADIILAVNPPNSDQIEKLKENSVWISMLVPPSNLEVIKKLQEKKITCFSMNLIPRISRAQRLDALSSQTNLAGYKAVIMAANSLGKIFPLMMTAAGTIKPAKVVILGAGVAGLSAVATAKRLGAQVEVSDVRPAVKEQVESLGAKFIEVPFDKDTEDKSGYAKQVSKEFLKRQAKEVAERIKTADIVITTALVPGKKAPILITEEMAASMKSGSVIVDLAASQGGNCALSEPGKTIVKNGITIIGEENVPATIPVHATGMYAKNILYFLSGIIKEGKLEINKEDEIYRDSLITSNGKIENKMVKDLLEQKNGAV